MHNSFLSQRRIGFKGIFVTTGYWLACFSIAILSACSSQDNTSSDIAGTNAASTASKTVASSDTATMPTIDSSVKFTSSDLLTNLAIAYPGGVLPAERAAAAAAQLLQNPAVLKYNANNAISAQSLAVSPQAAGSYTVGLSSPVQRAQNTTLFGSYFFSIYPAEMTNALATNPTWNLEGTAFHASLGINPGLSPVYRFRNLLNGSYLYTIDENEKNTIVANYSATFTLEGTAWFASPAPAAGYSPLYRFQNLTNGTYLFSAYEAEKDAIVANYAGIFLLEGISYYVRQTAPLELSLVAGSGTSGSANGTGATASLNYVYGMVQDSAGNMFTTDYSNHTIRKITPAGVVSTYAGAAATPSNTNGALLTARFNLPIGIVVDAADNLYIADANNNVIRKITPAGVVSNFAGISGTAGYFDATGTAAKFSGPRGLAIDNVGNIYVAERYNHVIRKITPAGVVTTVAGLGATPGFINAAGTAARFNNPVGVALDATGNLLVADGSNNVIRKITTAGVVSTFAGSDTGLSGSTDGVGNAAKFKFPYGITVATSGNVYVADHDNYLVRKITPAGSVTTIVGTLGSTGSFIEGLLPGVLDASRATASVRIQAGELYIGSLSRIYKVNGLP